MLTIAYYFLQVVLCSGMMMGYYWLVLRNKRFHQYNRFYLLAAALLSWIVPLIKITWSRPVVISEQPQVMQFLTVVADNNSQIEETISAQPVAAWSWDLPLTGIYFAVAAILFFGMVRAFTRLYRLLRDHSCKNVGDVYLVLTQAKGTPFSFFRYIFWNEEIDIRSEAGKQILQHELTHVQQKHSFDKLFIQVILIGGWFNPFFWLLRKEMDMIHEFIADKKAVNNGDTASLAQMLLTAAYPQQQFSLTHPFFFSPIKRRLQMLTNNKNPRYSYIRRLVVLPLLAIVIVLFAFRSKDRRESGELSVATVMENVAADQKQFFNSFLQGIDHLFENNATNNQAFRSVFYNGRPVTVPTSFRLKDLDYMVVTHLDKDHLNLIPALHLSQNTTDPLYVIDGVKQNGKAVLEQLNPDDIDMIQIWKGADALAKYGDAGKDGVIEITTKSFTANKKSADGFNGLVYEGVAKDPLSNIAGNRQLYVKVTIYQGETDKALVWEETHMVQSNENGAYSFTLGKDVKSSSKPESEIEKIDWTKGPFFVNLGIAVAPSIVANWWVPQDNYTDAGTTKMMAIPFPPVTARSTLEKIYFRIRGRSLTVPANSTAYVTIDFNSAKKGDQVYVNPKEDPLGKWAIYSAGVDEDGTIKLRFANYSDKAITVSSDSYIIGLGKFNGPPSAGWTAKLADVLIVIDGEIYREKDRDAINMLNPNDFRSVDVLKDAKAIEKFGPEAKNGVISITTKSQNGSWKLKIPEKNRVALPSIAVTSTALDPLGNPARNRKVFVKDIIYQGSAMGTKVWEETHEVLTNNEGLFTVYVGLGTKTPSIAAEDLGKIDWAKGPYFINYKVAVYPSVPAAWWVPADNLMDVGTTQMLSVPYSLYNKNDGAGNAKNMTASIPADRFLITDSLGNVNWQKPGPIPPSVKYPDTSVRLKGTLHSSTLPYITTVGKRLLPQPGRELAKPPFTFTGQPLDNSPAAIAFRKRNPDIKFFEWRDKTHVSIMLKDGTEETYDISKPDSKKRAETKYGKLPPAPVKFADRVTNPNEFTVPGTIVGGTFSGTISARTIPGTLVANNIKSDEVTVVGYPRRSMEPASFPGGLSAWTKYLERTLDEDVPRKKGASPGRYTVILSFDVSKDGIVSNVRAENDPGYGTKEEAMRIIVNGPKWKPAAKDGKNIAYTHQVSITFYVKEPKAENMPAGFNANLTTAAGKDVTVGPNTTMVTTVNVPGVKKGDPILVTPQDDYQTWSIYSAWVADDNKVNVRFANYTDKEVKILGSQYKIVAIKQ